MRVFAPAQLRVIFLRELKTWELWSLDITNAFLQADGFARGVFLHARSGWGPSNACRFRKLNAPAYRSNDAQSPLIDLCRNTLLYRISPLPKRNGKTRYPRLIRVYTLFFDRAAGQLAPSQRVLVIFRDLESKMSF